MLPLLLCRCRWTNCDCDVFKADPCQCSTLSDLLQAIRLFNLFSIFVCYTGFELAILGRLDWHSLFRCSHGYTKRLAKLPKNPVKDAGKILDFHWEVLSPCQL